MKLEEKYPDNLWDISKIKKITEKKCLEINGHCFESTGEVLTSNPPQYPEICKHCNKEIVGIPQPLMRYYEK